MKKYTALFIDDKVQDYIDQLKKICKNSFTFIFEKDPREAIKKFKFSEIQPDIIILDLNFQRIEIDIKGYFPDKVDIPLLGLHLLEIFRQMDPDIPIVFLSAFGNITTAHNAGLTGANAFYVKKYELRDQSLLEAKLEAICKNSHYSYDREQQKIAEEVAQANEYRKLESKSAGTVAYWHFEESKVVEIINSYITDNKGDKRIKILDIGISDGRFPEVLFKKSSHSSIVGVKFSFIMVS